MPDTQQTAPARANMDRMQVLLHRTLETTEPRPSQQEASTPWDLVEQLRRTIDSMNQVSAAPQRLHLLLRTALRLVPAAQHGAIYLSAGQDDQTFLIGAVFPEEPGGVGSEVNARGGYVGAVADLQSPAVLSDIDQERIVPYPGSNGGTTQLRSALVVPFTVGGQTVAVLALENYWDAQAFDADDLDCMSLLATYTALAVDNARASMIASAQQLAQQSGLRAWRELAERIPLGLILVCPHRHDLWANPAMCRMSGFSCAEIASNWAIASSLFSKDLGELCPNSLGEPREMCLVRRDGSRCSVRLTFQSLEAVGVSGAEGYLGVVEDLSAGAALERKLFHMQRLSDVGALVSAVSHELNNPLTAVVGFAELVLAREDVPTEAREDLATVVRQAERSVRVVRDLLDYVRAETECPTQLDINHVVQQLVRFRAHAVGQDDLEIVLDLADSLPMTLGNAHQLQQVLLNLINNAEQAIRSVHREGRIWIRTRMSDDQGYIRVSVRDNGPGVPPEVQSRIFEPFFTTKGSGEGTGLGLSICKQIVERHRGCIWLENDPGRGAAFVIDLPASPAMDVPLAEEQPEVDQQCGVPPAHILVVDDEKSISHLMDKILSRMGHRVDVAWNGSHAIRKLEDNAYDIVFLDLKIPGLSGQAVYKWIKEGRPQLVGRTVILTGDTLSKETVSFLDRERAAHLLKPFQVMDLRTVMQRIWPPTALATKP